MYGDAAAKPMRQWFDLLHEKAADGDVHLFVHTHLNPEPGLPMQYFTPELLAEGARLHDEAEKLAAGNDGRAEATRQGAAVAAVRADRSDEGRPAPSWTRSSPTSRSTASRTPASRGT